MELLDHLDVITRDHQAGNSADQGLTCRSIDGGSCSCSRSGWRSGGRDNFYQCSLTSSG